MGRSPFVSLLNTHTHSPDDRTVSYAHETCSYPKVTLLDDSPSPRTAQIDRAHMHSPLTPNFQSIFQPSNQAHGTPPFSIGNMKAHAAHTLNRPWR